MLKAEVLETMLYGCVTWSPRACHYDTLRRAHHRLLTRCIGWRKHSRTDHPISYLDTLVKTGSESIEATLRKRRILFAGFVVRMEDTRLPKCVMFGEVVGGAGSAGGQEKEWMGCLLDDLRAFGIQTDQWTVAAQDEGEWHKKAKQGAEHFMTKWIAAERARAALRHAVTCPNVTGRTKERVAQIKRARAGLLATVDQPQWCELVFFGGALPMLYCSVVVSRAKRSNSTTVSLSLFFFLSCLLHFFVFWRRRFSRVYMI